MLHFYTTRKLKTTHEYANSEYKQMRLPEGSKLVSLFSLTAFYGKPFLPSGVEKIFISKFWLKSNFWFTE